MLPASVYQHRRHTTANILKSSIFPERMLRNAAAKDLGPLCPARPQRFPCSPSFRALTIYIPRLSRLKEYPRLRQTRTTSATSNFNPTRAMYFLLASDPSIPRLFPFLLQFDLWKTFFADLSTRPFPFLLEFDLRTAYFVEPPCAFFSSENYSIALSNDFDTV